MKKPGEWRVWFVWRPLEWSVGYWFKATEFWDHSAQVGPLCIARYR